MPTATFVVWAAAGALWPARGPSNVLLRISVPQAYLHGAADAAAEALVALSARHASGAAARRHSAQQSASLATLSSTTPPPRSATPTTSSRPTHRARTGSSISAARRAHAAQRGLSRTGLLEMHPGMGRRPAARPTACSPDARARRAAGGVRWLGLDQLPQRILADDADDAQLDRARDAVAAFLCPYTKQQLMEERLRAASLMRRR
ncbi:MAG: hypothetical protein U1F11_10175 [Steroidobacteraceae bacterium]